MHSIYGYILQKSDFDDSINFVHSDFSKCFQVIIFFKFYQSWGEKGIK